MCMIDGCDPCDVYATTSPKARIPHKCDECRRTIEPGEVYQRTTMLFDDDWTTSKTCEHCLAAAQWLIVVCGGWVHHGLAEDLNDHQQEGYNPRWLAIAVSGVRKGWKTQNGKLWRPMKLPRRSLLPLPENAR